MNHTEVGEIKGKINTKVFNRYLNIAKNDVVDNWWVIANELSRFNGCFTIRNPLQRAIADMRYLDKLNKPQR
jgi:hypothetical protein